MAMKMNDKLFRLVKLMLNSGASVAETAEYFQLAKGTVQRVKASENMDEYHAILAAMHAKAPKQPEKPAPAQPEALGTHYMNNRVYELLKEQNELLKLLSNKLAFIVEALQ